MKALSVDLNSDLGESFGVYSVGMDEEVLSVVTSANVACGFHAGDANVMAKTVRLCKEKGVAVGAHPGLPDLIGFGRRYMKVDPDEVYRFVAYQIGALQAFCYIEEVEMHHVKPHGALYNMAAKEKAIAEAIAGAVKDVNPNFILYGLAESELIKAAEEIALPYASEVFADRTYQPDGSLTPRSWENAMINDPIAAEEQVMKMVNEGKVMAADGSFVPIKADTVCVHGDGPKAIEFATTLRRRLTKEGIQIKRAGE